MKDRQLLEEICERCNHYCTLKEIIMHSGVDDRTAMQIKIIDMFKYDWSAEAGRDLGWEETTKRYVDQGYAARFADYWHEHAHVSEIYTKLLNRKP